MDGLLVPLEVRLITSRADRFVTAELTDLSYRSVVPGGFASGQASLHRPLRRDADEIEQYGRLVAYDRRTAEVAWEGWQTDPGRGAGPQGELWTIGAIGPSAHAKDVDGPLIYSDYILADRWYRNANSSQAGQDGINTDGADLPALTFAVPRGTVAAAGGFEVGLDYRPIREAGQHLARWDYYHSEQIGDANWRVQGITKPSGTLARDEPFTVGATAGANKRITADFPAGDDVLFIRIRRVTAGVTVADDITGSTVGGIRVIATRYSKAGVELTAAASYGDGVLSSEVVEDLLGRRLPWYDGANASVQLTAYRIDQLAYVDGVTADKVFADLIEIEGAFIWAAWERPGISRGGIDKYRFQWLAWPTEVTYELEVEEDFDSPGSASELYDAVNVRWVDGAGFVHTTRRTNPVAVLLGAGVPREATLNLGDEVASSANAAIMGDAFLLEHSTAPNAGSITVTRPILNCQTGRMVPPHMIRPGVLLRVRNVTPRPDAINAAGHDGQTIFRVVATNYTARGNACTLELDSAPRSLARAVALTRRQLARARRR